MGRMMGEYFLPLMGNFGFLDFFKHDTDVADSDVTPAYCAKHNWLVGSPATVAEKIEEVYHDARASADCWCSASTMRTTPQAWHNSLRLLAEEVGPRVAHLVPGRKAAAE